VEAWTTSTEEKNTLRIYEGKIARKICGPVKEGGNWRIRENKEKGYVTSGRHSNIYKITATKLV
jgi:pSer/pThr/pTyr-binding forkhead associated (FHA) protein